MLRHDLLVEIKDTKLLVEASNNTVSCRAFPRLGTHIDLPVDSRLVQYFKFKHTLSVRAESSLLVLMIVSQASPSYSKEREGLVNGVTSICPQVCYTNYQ